MSWSINQSGKAAAVKVALEKQFEQAKKGCAHMPHEVQAIGTVEQLVSAELDFLDPNTPVQVEGSGSAYAGEKSRGSQVKVKVEPIYNWAE